MCVLFRTEKLSRRKLNVAEVTQSEIGQKQKLQTVLEAVNELLRTQGWTIDWGVDCEFGALRSVCPVCPPTLILLLLKGYMLCPVFSSFSNPLKEPGGHRALAGHSGHALYGPNQAP